MNINLNTNTLYEAIGSIDDSIIQQTNYILQYRQKNRTLKWILAIACFVLIFLGAARLIPPQTTQINTDLPILALNHMSDMGAMGSGGEFAFTISELENDNPWNDGVVIDTLPVYKNQVERGGAGEPQTGLTVEEMEVRIHETARALGITIGEITVYPTNDTQIPYEAKATGEGITIQAGADNTVYISFDTPIVLPSEYNFTRHNTSYEEGSEALSYLIDTFQELLDFESPAIDLSGSYYIYADHSFIYKVYENKGSISEQMVNYEYKCAHFYPNENGGLSAIRLYHTDLSEKIGDYPLISSSKALKLLLKGTYIAPEGYEIPDKKNIAKVELVYNYPSWEEYLMPYYRFYVEVPEDQLENGLKLFIKYDVPAINENYYTFSP